MDRATADSVRIRLSARLWSGIDSQIDNVVNVEIVGGDEEAVEVGTSIREAGLDQVPWVDGQWPPMDQDIDIELTRMQWQFAVKHLERAEASYSRIGDHESLDLVRRARAAVAEQLR